MNDTILTTTQAFQLAAIGPCIFVIFYLFITARKKQLVVLPIMYFVSLACMFFLPLANLVVEIDVNRPFLASLKFIEYLQPELSFLIIIQFIYGRFPAALFWLILCLPVFGGSGFLYLSLEGQEVCFSGDGCFSPDYLMTLYRLFGASFVYLLLTFILIRKRPWIEKSVAARKHRYWLIVSLIAFNVLLQIVDLVMIYDELRIREVQFVKTMIGIAFIYLMLSSVFRVFNKSLEIRPLKEMGFSEQDQKLLVRITEYLQAEKPYRNLGFNRGSLAGKMGVTEQKLSKVINMKFGKSFSELMNEYRLDEAISLLKETAKPITTISYDVGFTSVTSFNRVFKQKTGKSPSDFRNDARGIPS